MKTFFMVKPDGVKRNIVGQVIDRVEQEGFKISKNLNKIKATK